MKNDQSDSNTMINKLVKQRLSQSAKALGDRHNARLEQMTINATQHYLKNQSVNSKNLNKYRNYIRPFTFPLAIASSVLFVFWLWWPAGQQVATENKTIVAKVLPSDTAMPEWVLDTSVPISLLNNRAFYDWLDKQKDMHNNG